MSEIFIPYFLDLYNVKFSRLQSDENATGSVIGPTLEHLMTVVQDVAATDLKPGFERSPNRRGRDRDDCCGKRRCL